MLSVYMAETILRSQSHIICLYRHTYNDMVDGIYTHSHLCRHSFCLIIKINLKNICEIIAFSFIFDFCFIGFIIDPIVETFFC